jgi:hypothetical protein
MRASLEVKHDAKILQAIEHELYCLANILITNHWLQLDEEITLHSFVMMSNDRFQQWEVEQLHSASNYLERSLRMHYRDEDLEDFAFHTPSSNHG